MSNMEDHEGIRVEEYENLCKRLRCVEEMAARDRDSTKELQSKFIDLNASIEKALTDLMPQVEALIGSRENQSLPSGTPAFLPCSLLDAAEVGDVDKVFHLLEADVKPFQRNSHGQSALHLAAKGGHKRCVVILIGYGAVVNVVDRVLRTPLHYAVMGGHLGVARLLLKAGNKVDYKDSIGNTPLILSVSGNHPELVSLLLQHKASPSVQDQNGDTVLLMAAKTGKWKLVEVLASTPGVCLNEKDNEGSSVLAYCVRAQKRNIVKLLLEKDASYIFKGRKCTALQVAVDMNDEEIVRQILSSEGNQDIIRSLCRVKDPSVMWVFEDYCPGILHGEVGQSAMRLAAHCGFLDSLVCLLDGGIDINAVNKGSRNSALTFASAFSQPECVSVLLNRGADINHRNYSDSTALHYASRNGEEEIVRILLEAGADANIKNKENKTPLDIAKTAGVRQLLSPNLSI